MKIVPFKSYHQNIFKEALYEIHANLLIKSKIQDSGKYFMYLRDYYIYSGEDSDQCLVMLFDPISTSLANVAEYRHKSNWYWKN